MSSSPQPKKRDDMVKRKILQNGSMKEKKRALLTKESYEILVTFPPSKQERETVVGQFKPLGLVDRKLSRIRIHCVIAKKEEYCYLFYGTLEPSGVGAEEAVCVKVLSPVSMFSKEFEAVLRLSTDGRVAFLVPEVYGFLKFRYEGKAWGGMCMQHVQYCVNAILFPVLATEKSLRTLHAAMEAFPSSSDPTSSRDFGGRGEEEGGLAIEKIHGADFRTCLIATCLKALGIMHAAGWVHGDTHLGNFMVDLKTWRLYLIDFERTFRSKDCLQHFLDVQELMGHATGLIMSDAMHSLSWDLLNVPGVTSLDATYKAEDMLPVCVCFACATRDERIEGCKRCLSPHTRQKALAYSKDPDGYAAALCEATLAQLQAETARKKEMAKKELESVSDELMREIPRMMSREDSGLPAAFYESGFMHLDSDVVLREKFREAVADMLYSGAFVEDGHKDGVMLVRALEKAKEGAALARMLDGHIRRFGEK